MEQIVRRKIGSILASLFAAFFAVLPIVSHAQEVLWIGGTGSALGSMKILAKAFERSHPAIKVMVMPSIGSGGAIRAVSKGSLNVGVVSRSLTDEEKHMDLTVIEYAKTPFVPVAENRIKVRDLRFEEIEKIYRGEMQTWPNGERIRLVVRPAADADTALIRKISPEMSKAVDIALSREGMLQATTDQDNADLLEKTPGAFGFTTLTQILTEKSRLKILSLNGVQPGLSALAQGSYPLAKTLSLLTIKDPLPSVRKFRDFVLSPEGRALLEKTGNIPVAGSVDK
jgi:phosphate transport system substrate-binding protein